MQRQEAYKRHEAPRACSVQSRGSCGVTQRVTTGSVQRRGACRDGECAETWSMARKDMHMRDGRGRKGGHRKRYWRHAPRARSVHMWRPRVGAQEEATRSKTEKGACFAFRWGGPVRPVDVVLNEPTTRAVGRCLDSACAGNPGRGKPRNSAGGGCGADKRASCACYKWLSARQRTSSGGARAVAVRARTIVL